MKIILRTAVVVAALIVLLALGDNIITYVLNGGLRGSIAASFAVVAAHFAAVVACALGVQIVWRITE